MLITPLLSADGSGVLYRYGVLDGGRLSLVTPNGDTQVFNVEISDDQFELQGSMPLAGTHSQRFARLPEGQTLQQGIEQYQKAREAEYQARHDAVENFLAQPGLVIVPTAPAQGAPTRMALEVDATGRGKAWYDDQAPHLDQVTTARMFRCP